MGECVPLIVWVCQAAGLAILLLALLDSGDPPAFG